MRYTVVWAPAAQNALADIWTQTSARKAVADAADEIDRLLRRDPLSRGEEQGTRRRLVVEPLEVLFTVSPDDRLVQVEQVSELP